MTNGVSAFVRVLNEIIEQENLVDTFAYLDDITVCGKTLASHDKNLDKFLNVAKKYNLTINSKKCAFRQDTINVLGYQIGNGVLKPDPGRLAPLLNIPAPANSKAQQRVVGMFAHYSKWIYNFSQKIRPLVINKDFPVSGEVLTAFERLKREVAESVVAAVDESQPFVIETDASDNSIAAQLLQNGRPVAFFSRTLNVSEKHHSSVEKEAYAIVESIRKWRHYLIGRYFKVVTDQRSVSFMFSSKHSSKVKNEKILRWRLELSSYTFDISYRPGKENGPADTLSRVCAATTSTSVETLEYLHTALCHPGVTRMNHYVKSKNFPYSLQDIRATIAKCDVCARLKPKFFRSTGTLIKATQPFERISVDFKGPLPSASDNKYILTIVDEYSRFPFAFPCKDMTADAVISCFTQLFSVFGMPSYVHSDRGTSFMSDSLKAFLNNKGVATSRSSPYNPTGNGQVERYNAIVWNAVKLALASRDLPIKFWECVLPDALHSIRSLLCTATNATPHERMFSFTRRSSCGGTIPSWLTQQSRVLMKNFKRQSKYDPLVEEVELVDVNPEYAFVRLDNGRETSVSLKHLAPLGSGNNQTENSTISSETPMQPSSGGTYFGDDVDRLQNDNRRTTATDALTDSPADAVTSPEDSPATPITLRRSSRVRRAPSYYGDSVRN